MLDVCFLFFLCFYIFVDTLNPDLPDMAPLSTIMRGWAYKCVERGLRAELFEDWQAGVKGPLRSMTSTCFSWDLHPVAAPKQKT
jgi:hypothetical protein